MTRSTRLLAIIQSLRRRRRPVAAAVLADELGVSERTIYRDIATLVTEGAAIRGGPGQGYVLDGGFMLPPLMFSDAEIDALVLGLQLAAQEGDEELAEASDNALAKLAAVLPPERRRLMEESGLAVAPRSDMDDVRVSMPMLRQALREERKLRLCYRDRNMAVTTRIVWPVALAFFDEAQSLAAWCELRQDFRSFRLDRIAAAELLEERLPKRRATLMRAWREAVGAPDPG